MATERITAPIIKRELDDHFTRHTDVYDPMLKRHDILLVGEDGDNGICSDVREIVTGFRTVKGVGYGVIIAVVADIVSRYIIK